MGIHLNTDIVKHLRAQAADNIKNGRMAMTREDVIAALMTGPGATQPRKKTVRRYLNALPLKLTVERVEPGPHRDFSVQDAPDTRDDKYLHAHARNMRALKSSLSGHDLATV